MPAFMVERHSTNTKVGADSRLLAIFTEYSHRSHTSCEICCVTCNRTSIEGSQFWPSNSKSFQWSSKNWLQCSICHSFVNNSIENGHHEYWKCQALLQSYCALYTIEKDMYTLVCHPVGRHKDNFWKKSGSKLENRFCMSFDNDKNNWTNISGSGSRPYGRGDNGLRSYTYAILDW